MSLGPFKIFATGDQTSGVSGKRGWFYPIYLDEREAMKADITYKGKGIYYKVSFLERQGEFYLPENYKFLAQSVDPIIYSEYKGQGKENKFKRIQNRLSSLVPSQFPDFIQTEYTTFVEFVKAYYKFLEQNTGPQEILSNIKQYNDIDKTTTELVEKFLDTYAFGYNKSNITDNRFVIKNINQVLQSKGTEKSYKILFKVLYKETIDFLYPRTLILSPSDAIWKNRRFLRIVNSTQNNYFLFKDTIIRGTISNATAAVTAVTKIKIGPYEVYELELDEKKIIGTFVNEQITAIKTVVGDTGENTTITLTAAIEGNLISSIDIGRTQRGFKENQILNVVDLENKGTGGIIRVKRVNSFSRIKELEIIDPGINYSTNLVLQGNVTIPVDYARYDILDETIKISFQNEHDYIPKDFLDVIHVGEPTSNLLGQYYILPVISVPDNYTVVSKFPETGISLRPITNPVTYTNIFD